MTKKEDNQEWLCYLIKENKIQELEEFIKKEPIDWNFTHDIFSQSPLILAIQQNNLNVFNLLINYGANPHALISENHYNLLTFLPIVCNDLSIEFLNRLNELGLKTFQEDYKNSAFQLALNQGLVILAEKFLNLGSDINEVDKDNTPAIYKVVQRGNITSIDFLLEHKAALDFLDERGDSLIEIALQKGKLGLAQKLTNHGAIIKKINLKKIPHHYLDKVAEYEIWLEKEMLEKTLINVPNETTFKIKL